MRKLLALFAATVIAATGLPRAEAAVSVDFFYTSLEPHGAWLEVDDYGYVWQPSDLAEDWRPYTVGSWAYTDAGWTWVSDEPHGWVTHHYGRWVLVEPAGWVWVPDTEWAPAWVSWRRSTTYVGWAPLPPEARFERTVGIKTWSDSYYDIGPSYYSFVEVRNIGAPRLATVVLPPRENITIIRETQNITNIVVQNNIIINEGPKYDVIVRESAQPIRRLRLERQTDIAIEDIRGGDRRGRIEGEVFRVPAPEVQLAADIRPPRAARRLANASVNRGWKGLEDRPEAKELRAKLEKETTQPAGLPPEPKYERLAERAKRQRGPQDSTAIPEDAKKPAGDQPVVGTEGEMKEQDRAKQRAKTDAADDAQATGTEPAAPSEGRRNRRERNQRSNQPGAAETTPDKPADASAPEAAAPDATTRDGNANERQNRRMQERERAGAKEKAGDAAERAKTESEEATTPRGSREQRNAADKARMEAEEAAKTNAETGDANARREAEDRAKTEANTRREAAEASRKQSEANRSENEQRPQRGNRSSQRDSSEAASPETSAERPDSSSRRSGAERPDRSPDANEPRGRANNAGAERPERAQPAERPNRPERAERPERPAGAERPDRPGRQGGGEGAERPNRGNGGGGAAAAENGRGGERRGGGGGGNPNERRGGGQE